MFIDERKLLGGWPKERLKRTRLLEMLKYGDTRSFPKRLGQSLESETGKSLSKTLYTAG